MRSAIGIVISCVAVAVSASGQSDGVNLSGVLETYYAGQFDEAVSKAAALPDLGPLRLRFVQDTPAWISADRANTDKRRAAAAAFLVELTAARLESDWGRLSDLLEWTCAQILRTGPPTEFERRWHLATTALAGRARARLWLLGPYARLPHQKPLRRAPQKDDPPSPMHLLHALERFPDDARFRLARVNAWTWGRDSEPLRNVRREYADSMRRAAGSRPTQLEAVTAYEPLLNDPDVGGEAYLRTGAIFITVGDHAAALRSFEAAQPLVHTEALQYLSHFLAARSLEALQRPDEATAAYHRALAIVPQAESAVIALSSLEFARGNVEAALSLIGKTFDKPMIATDPGRLVGYGAFVHWPQIKAAMRAEVTR
jgi:tetratricopeptide (TPR) repeat protein